MFNDLITAVLLFGQFAILRSPALLVLASGYLFTAAMAFAHLLTFPGFNLKTAKALGLTIPPSLLLRRDQVIE